MLKWLKSVKNMKVKEIKKYTESDKLKSTESILSPWSVEFYLLSFCSLEKEIEIELWLIFIYISICDI